jgi:hypothetical protein
MSVATAASVILVRSSTPWSRSTARLRSCTHVGRSRVGSRRSRRVCGGLKLACRRPLRMRMACQWASPCPSLPRNLLHVGRVHQADGDNALQKVIDWPLVLPRNSPWPHGPRRPRPASQTTPADRGSSFRILEFHDPVDMLSGRVWGHPTRHDCLLMPIQLCTMSEHRVHRIPPGEWSAGWIPCWSDAPWRARLPVGRWRPCLVPIGVQVTRMCGLVDSRYHRPRVQPVWRHSTPSGLRGGYHLHIHAS